MTLAENFIWRLVFPPFFDSFYGVHGLFVEADTYRYPFLCKLWAENKLVNGGYCVYSVPMAGSTSENKETFELYKSGADMFCVVGIENKQTVPPRTPGTKNRYRQSYREVWESMRDFKGWLTSVPGNTSKAYCKLCQKELHCHRLSLLKHKVTVKHQKKEEEHNLLNQIENKSTETQAKKFKGDKNINLEDAAEESTDLDGNVKADIDESLLVSEAATSENCDDLFQDDETSHSSDDGPISTQVTDISKGQPGASIHVVLYKLINGRWTLIHEGLTNEDGQYNQFFSNNKKFSPGRYKLHFDVDKYFENINETTIFPFIEIAFDVKDSLNHYHIPLLLSPFGYSIYKWS